MTVQEHPGSSRPVSGVVYLLFFASGASGLIYEVVWVREFGNVFGNTVYSASLVFAVFMLGLGFGSYVIGRWADRPSLARGATLLRFYGYLELAIGLLGLLITLVLPHLGGISALLSTYRTGADGWYELSTSSYVARYATAVVLLTPITILMGGTLTVLIRALVQGHLESAGWKVGALYGINTAGAAAGCLLTDSLLVPAGGLRETQMVAVLLNLVAAGGALRLASREPPTVPKALPVPPPGVGVADFAGPSEATRAMALAGIGLFLSGFAAMGMELVWFRHLTLLLGGFRSVFSLLLTAILIGIGLGALVGGLLHRRFGQPVLWFVLAQVLFAVSTLVGLATADLTGVSAEDVAAARAVVAGSAWRQVAAELWFNSRPILRELAMPALMMGFAFPLGNAIIQRTESSIGGRAGALYLANTAGAVAGSLLAGFVFLPAVGMQHSAALLVGATVLAAAAMCGAAWAMPAAASARRLATMASLAAIVLAGAALTYWISLPGTWVITRAHEATDEGERLITISESVTGVIAISEGPGGVLKLTMDGHFMSGTDLLAQRYMRAFAHIPLLSMERPERVLVIGFGVGNTANAALLHPSIRRVEVVDLSRHLLGHADYFRVANRGALKDPRVAVYINDGRQHLRMRRSATYDLVTMEPPPIALAGVGALYSREFYELARARLRPGGYITQWLPAYQVSPGVALSMIRAFVEVFPHAVLLSGAEAELILMGVNDSRIEIDPAKLAARLKAAPAVQEDLDRVALGQLIEIIGSFVASADTLERASRPAMAESDDRPLQEYVARSRIGGGTGMPRDIFDVEQVAAWCPGCFVGGRPVTLVEGLDGYLTVLGRVYLDSTFRGQGLRVAGDTNVRRAIDGSNYLRGLVARSERRYREQRPTPPSVAAPR